MSGVDESLGDSESNLLWTCSNSHGSVSMRQELGDGAAAMLASNDGGRGWNPVRRSSSLGEDHRHRSRSSDNISAPRSGFSTPQGPPSNDLGGVLFLEEHHFDDSASCTDDDDSSSFASDSDSDFLSDSYTHENPGSSDNSRCETIVMTDKLRQLASSTHTVTKSNHRDASVTQPSVTIDSVINSRAARHDEDRPLSPSDALNDIGSGDTEGMINVGVPDVRVTGGEVLIREVERYRPVGSVIIEEEEQFVLVEDTGVSQVDGVFGDSGHDRSVVELRLVASESESPTETPPRSAVMFSSVPEEERSSPPDAVDENPDNEVGPEKAEIADGGSDEVLSQCVTSFPDQSERQRETLTSTAGVSITEEEQAVSEERDDNLDDDIGSEKAKTTSCDDDGQNTAGVSTPEEGQSPTEIVEEHLDNIGGSEKAKAAESSYDGRNTAGVLIPEEERSSTERLEESLDDNIGSEKEDQASDSDVDNRNTAGVSMPEEGQSPSEILEEHLDNGIGSEKAKASDSDTGGRNTAGVSMPDEGRSSTKILEEHLDDIVVSEKAKTTNSDDNGWNTAKVSMPVKEWSPTESRKENLEDTVGLEKAKGTDNDDDGLYSDSEKLVLELSLYVDQTEREAETLVSGANIPALTSPPPESLSNIVEEEIGTDSAVTELASDLGETSDTFSGTLASGYVKRRASECERLFSANSDVSCSAAPPEPTELFAEVDSAASGRNNSPTFFIGQRSSSADLVAGADDGRLVITEAGDDSSSAFYTESEQPVLTKDGEITEDVSKHADSVGAEEGKLWPGCEPNYVLRLARAYSRRIEEMKASTSSHRRHRGSRSRRMSTDRIPHTDCAVSSDQSWFKPASEHEAATIAPPPLDDYGPSVASRREMISQSRRRIKSVEETEPLPRANIHETIRRLNQKASSGSVPYERHQSQPVHSISETFHWPSYHTDGASPQFVSQKSVTLRCPGSFVHECVRKLDGGGGNC